MNRNIWRTVSIQLMIVISYLLAWYFFTDACTNITSSDLVLAPSGFLICSFYIWVVDYFLRKV
jgi:hypothetical protein